jgi:hypothetical protein
MTTTIESNDIQKLRFPIGLFEYGRTYQEEEMQQFIEKLESFPTSLKKLLTGITKQQLDNSYREGGWTIRQLIHHLADSHINAYTRMRLALTEDTPAIKPYDQQLWAELPDARTADPEASLAILTGIHNRWSLLMQSLAPEDFQRLYYHPEHQMSHTLSELIAQYAWHCDHHLAHIQMVTGIQAPAKPKISRAPKPKATAVKKTVKKQTGK